MNGERHLGDWGPYPKLAKDMSDVELEEFHAEQTRRRDAVLALHPEREFDLEREVPCVVWILETRRRAGGPWQPYQFPWEPDPLDRDPMYCNTRAKIQKQIDVLELEVRSAEWQYRVAEYTPRSDPGSTRG